MKSRINKGKELEKAEKLLDESKQLLFIDYSEIPAQDILALRRAVKAVDAKMMVIKKRLLNVALGKKGIECDVTGFSDMVGTIFASGEVEEVSGAVYRFLTELPETETNKKADFAKKMLGGYAIESKELIDSETIIAYGKLPSREVLLGQVLGGIIGPLRAFMYLLTQLTPGGNEIEAGPETQAEAVETPTEKAKEEELPEKDEVKEEETNKEGVEEESEEKNKSMPEVQPAAA